MGTKEDYKRERRQKTQEAAVSLVDDLAFFRKAIVGDQVSSGDLRRMSAQLRRILVDGVLEKVAGPRVGKLHLLAADATGLITSNRLHPFAYLGVGGVEMFGIEVAVSAIDRGSPAARDPEHFRPGATILLSPEDFMKQGVIVFEGDWITRREVIRYVANIAEGIHSGEARDYRERLIRRARHVAAMSLQGGMPTLGANISPLSSIDLPAIVDQKTIDGVLVELWATASFLCRSPDVLALETFIQNELASR